MPKALPTVARPNPLDIFTDRVGEQAVLRRVLHPETGDAFGSDNLLTVFYGVGGVGKSTLCALARRIIRDECGANVVSVSVTFDEARYTPSTPFTDVAMAVCRALSDSGVPPTLTLTLLGLTSPPGPGSEARGTDERWALLVEAVDKGVELAAIPGLALLVKGAQHLRGQAAARRVRERLVERKLWPESEDGRMEPMAVERLIAQALFHDVADWMKAHPQKHVRCLLDGFERLQGTERGEDAQQRLQEWVGYFAHGNDGGLASSCRFVLFGRERLRWDELYEDPTWRECWQQHLLGGLAERDALDYLEKTVAWYTRRGATGTAEAIGAHVADILDAADEGVGADRRFYPYSLALAVDLVERAAVRGEPSKLGRTPMELHERFFRYLGDRERRALLVLGLAETFDDALFDWLAHERLVGYEVGTLHSSLRRDHSYFLPVEERPGTWRFHRLFEDALHASWRRDGTLRAEGVHLVERLLLHFGAGLSGRPGREWTDEDAERWRQGMEVLVTQGPELELLPRERWSELLAMAPWKEAPFRCIRHHVGFARRVLAQREAKLGPDHLDTLQSVDDLAVALGWLGDREEAARLLRRALDARERVFGTAHASTAVSMNKLADVLYDLGELEDAVALSRRAVEIQERLLGAEHPDTLYSINNLAAALEASGHRTEAIRLHRRALEAQQRVLGPEHRDTIVSMSNLAFALKAGGEFGEAVALLRTAATTQERIHGPDNPVTLIITNNLGNALRGLGDLEEAERIQCGVLAARERLLGPEHPHTLRSVHHLACTQEAAGKLDLAEAGFRRALSGQQTRIGPRHPDTIRSLQELASLLRRQNRFDELEGLVREAGVPEWFDVTGIRSV